MAASPSMRKDGFTSMPDLLTCREVERLRQSIPGLRATRAVGSCERPNNTLVPLRWNDASVFAVLNDVVRVRRIRTASGGTDLRWISGYFSVKDSRSGPLWWHQDWWCWNHAVTRQPHAPQVALLCYLDDTTVTSGALRVLPGSHLESSAIHAVLPDSHSSMSHLAEPDNPVVCDQPGQVTLEVRAGDAVLLDYRVLHGTHPNAADRERDCLILNFVPSWSRLPDDVRAHLIGGLGLPTDAERRSAAAMLGHLLPRYRGVQRDLVLSRDAPAKFCHVPSQREDTPIAPTR
jgi:ectoine hydroxylase-related dioxygenase (phytanoyl-CoA dioxygenase family)